MTGQSTLRRLGQQLGWLKIRYLITLFNLFVDWYTSSRRPMASVSALLDGCYLGTWFFIGKKSLTSSSSEVFPLSIRSKGVALSTASNWLNNCRRYSRIFGDLELIWHSVLVGLITPFIMGQSPGYVPWHPSYVLCSNLT